jgi:hypothetical protein
MRLKFLAILLLACASLLGPRLFAQPAFTVAWKDSQLSVRAVNAPLADVIAEIAKAAGIDVRGADKLAGGVTADINNVPLVDGLKTMLDNVNYALSSRETPNGTQPMLVIAGMSGTARPVKPEGALIVPLLDSMAMSNAMAHAEEQQEAADDADADDSKRDDLAEAQKLEAEGAFGSSAKLDDLVDFMDDLNPEIRGRALGALCARPLKVSLEPIVKALDDDDYDVSEKAIAFLGASRDAAVLAAMGKLLRETEGIGQKIEALRVLALRADRASIPMLQALIKQEPESLTAEAAKQMLLEFERRRTAK